MRPACHRLRCCADVHRLTGPAAGRKSQHTPAFDRVRQWTGRHTSSAWTRAAAPRTRTKTSAAPDQIAVSAGMPRRPPVRPRTAQHKEGEMSDHDERWVLLHLIEMCRNEERALRFAADHISDHGVRDLLEELAERRGAFAEELVPHAQRLGGAASVDGTSKASLRQRWTALKGALLGHKEEALIKDAEHMERQTLSTFEHALDDLLPETTHDLIEKQC